jgi:hypothetical protein
MTRLLSTAAAATLGAVLFAGGANAVTLQSSVAFDDPTFTYPALADATTLPDSASWDAGISVRSGNADGVYRTPWDETSNSAIQNATLDLTVIANTDYFAVGPSNLPNPATLSFTVDQKSLTFLWGSPDGFNTLVFSLDGAEVGSFVGSAVTPPASAGSSLVTFAGRFDQISFGSSPNNAFEFASITTTPVPLPAGVVLMLSGLGGLGLMRRRRKSES